MWFKRQYAKMFQNWIDVDGGNIGHVQLFCAFTSFSHCLLWADIILYLRINYLNLLFKYSYKPLSSVTFIYHTRLVRRLLLNETSSMKKKSFKHKLSFLRYTFFALISCILQPTESWNILYQGSYSQIGPLWMASWRYGILSLP